jgi:hypothetical protein
MLDGRGKNGGARVGAGRKPKADEIQVIEMMDAALAPNEVWSSLANLVRDGDVQAVKTWLNYRYGMPKQQLNVDATIMEFPSPIIEMPNE